MDSLIKTPVSIITGFLGSGKTTLISNLINKFRNGKLAIIVNEFGDLGVDGEILKSCAIPNCPEENIIELSNGCICCTVADDFIPTIESLLKMKPKPDQIIIETSGLALPKPLLKAFEWPEIKSKITVDGVIALADAEAVSNGRFAPSIEAVNKQRLADKNVSHDTPLSEVFEDQVNCADLILLTKCDNINQVDLLKSKSIINNIKNNPKPIIEVINGKINPKILLSLQSEAENDLKSRPSHHDNEEEHDHEDFDSIVLNLDEIEDEKEICKKIERLTEDYEILRIKGYLSIKNKPMRFLIQSVGSRVRGQYDKMWEPNEIKQSKLVFIVEHDKINKTIIQKYILG